MYEQSGEKKRKKW